MAGRRLHRFRTSLTANLVAVVLLLGGLLWVAAHLAVSRAVETLSDQLTRRVMAHTEARLDGFVRPISNTLRQLGLRTEASAFDGLDPRALDPVMTAMISALPQISSAMVAYEDGSEYMLLASRGGWQSRIVHPDAPDGLALWREWSDGEQPPAGERLAVDYDSAARPWHVGARELATRHGADAPFADRTSWTTPYRFFTTQEPGITVSVAMPTRGGRQAVVALDLLLADISRFTMGLTEGRRAKAFVLRGDPADPTGVAILGLPADKRFDDDPNAIDRMVLQSPSELGGPVHDFLSSGIQSTVEVHSFISGGEEWWGALEPTTVPLSEGVWVGSVVPTAELLKDIPDLRPAIAGVTLLLLLAAVLRARRLARLYSAPLADLVHRGERLQRLDFRVPEETETRISEIRQLATTLESARGTLEAFHAEPEDARVARSVRAMLLPGEAARTADDPEEAVSAALRRIPAPPAWSLAVWHEPSPDVEGELVDVIAADDGTLALLLADLPGTGVPAAVDGAQLRAAFRAGVGRDVDLEALAASLERFAARDLGQPSSRAWLGRLDPATGRLSARSLGLAPATAGVAWDGQLAVIPSGGAIVLASDGVVDALDERQRRFGEAGLASVVEAWKGEDTAEPAARLVDELREALRAFSVDTPRDRTALVLVRRAGGGS